MDRKPWEQMTFNEKMAAIEEDFEHAQAQEVQRKVLETEVRPLDFDTVSRALSETLKKWKTPDTGVPLNMRMLDGGMDLTLYRHHPVPRSDSATAMRFAVQKNRRLTTNIEVDFSDFERRLLKGMVDHEQRQEERLDSGRVRSDHREARAELPCDEGVQEARPGSDRPRR